MRYPPTQPPFQSFLNGPDPVADPPSAWFVKKYWWIAVPVALAIGGRVLERRRQKTLTAYNMLEDISTIAAPGLGVLGVIALIRQEHADALMKEIDEGNLDLNAQPVEGYYR
jgi:hypothetical protein